MAVAVENWVAMVVVVRWSSSGESRVLGSCYTVFARRSRTDKAVFGGEGP